MRLFGWQIASLFTVITRDFQPKGLEIRLVPRAGETGEHFETRRERDDVVGGVKVVDTGGTEHRSEGVVFVAVVHLAAGLAESV